MKFSVLASAFGTVVSFSSSVSAADPLQKFYIPLAEEQALNDLFHVISSDAVSPIYSGVSIACSSDNTIIWWDQWEDNFDPDPTNANGNKQSTTEIWGDGDASNGCAPGRSCTDQNDVLNAGDVVVVSQAIAIPQGGRDKNDIYYDGGDLMMTSRPVAMTKLAFPSGAGSKLAGAVEVVEQKNWGTSFEAPVGQNSVNGQSAYQYTAFAVMAGDDGAEIKLNGQVVATLGQGGSKIIRVEKQGNTLVASHPVQVHLLAGDIGSTYELRWYSLAPTDQWSNEYYAPVGDTKGQVKVTLYNPSNNPIQVVETTRSGTTTIDVNGKGTAVTGVLEDGVAAKFESNDKFFAFSLTDTGRTDTGQNTAGQIFDWGYPLMTRDMLTPEVLIGMGWGCTGNQCSDGRGSRSVVWVTPVENAEIWVDFENSGTVDKHVSAQALEGINIIDSDHDMTGAVIWATKAGSDREGEGVDIASAWGQKAALSLPGDALAMDLGTVVLPFEPLRAICKVILIDDKDNSGDVTPGDTVMFVVEVINAGQIPIGAGSQALDTIAGVINLHELAGGDSQIFNKTITVPPGGIDVDACEKFIPAQPTSSPTASPSQSPTQAPATLAPTGAPSPKPTPNPTPPKTGGDPHFRTWTGTKFDYHGECDLVLIDHPGFAHGLGLRVHFRTTRVNYFSFIETVAIRVGTETLEFSNDLNNFLVNGSKVRDSSIGSKNNLSGYEIRRYKSAISLRLDKRRAHIDLYYRKSGFPYVKFDANGAKIFEGSVGLLGDYHTGKMLGRDGTTEYEDATEFALEWQVRDTEPMIFSKARAPQYPTTCTPPKKQLGKRLGDSHMKKVAEEACASWKEDKDECIFDVMAARSIDSSEAIGRTAAS